MRNKPSLPFVYLLLSLTLVFHSVANAADSTSFNPRTVQVTAKAPGGGVPVGTVVAWPVSLLPSGDEAGKWLECDGQAISQAAYPELYAVVGGTVPNYQGMFLRGHGTQDSSHYGTVAHSSGSLGQVQGDAIRNMGGGLVIPGFGWESQGAFTWTGGLINHQWNTRSISGTTGNIGAGFFDFQPSRVAPTANENRPVNKAVKYLIKAKP